MLNIMLILINSLLNTKKHLVMANFGYTFVVQKAKIIIRSIRLPKS